MRPCPNCQAVVENHTQICPHCRENLKERQPRTTAVRAPAREVVEAEKRWYRLHYLTSLFMTGVVSAVCVAAWGWWGIPAGLGISSVLYCLFLGLQLI